MSALRISRTAPAIRFSSVSAAPLIPILPLRLVFTRTCNPGSPGVSSDGGIALSLPGGKLSPGIGSGNILRNGGVRLPIEDQHLCDPEGASHAHRPDAH